MEVRVSHKRRPSVLREVAAYATRVSAGAGVEHDAELVVVDVVGVAADFAEVVLHVDGEFELGLDDGDERVLGDGALLGRQPPQRHERVQVLVRLVLLLVHQLQFLQVRQHLHQHLLVDLRHLPLVQELVQLRKPLLLQVVTAS